MHNRAGVLGSGCQGTIHLLSYPDWKEDMRLYLYLKSWVGGGDYRVKGKNVSGECELELSNREN